jgi:hypothetical protein
VLAALEGINCPALLVPMARHSQVSCQRAGSLTRRLMLLTRL